MERWERYRFCDSIALERSWHERSLSRDFLPRVGSGDKAGGLRPSRRVFLSPSLLHVQVPGILVKFMFVTKNIDIIYTQKKGKLRLCINYKNLNKIIRRNYTLLPFIGKILNRLIQIKIYIKLNLKNVYYRIYIKYNDKWKIIFKIKYEYFEYLIILFKFINALIIFQTYINIVLTNLINIIYMVYLNDIFIYFKKKKPHMQIIRKILNKFRK